MVVPGDARHLRPRQGQPGALHNEPDRLDRAGGRLRWPSTAIDGVPWRTRRACRGSSLRSAPGTLGASVASASARTSAVTAAGGTSAIRPRPGGSDDALPVRRPVRSPLVQRRTRVGAAMTSETKLRDLERDLKQAIADFNTLQSRPSKKLPSPLFALVHQLPSIARRAFSPGPGIDGFSGGSSLGGGRGGGPKIKVPNEDGDDELVEVTTVEAAMFALDAAARNPSAREGDPVGTIGERAARLFVVA